MSERVLFVDDEEMILSSMERMMEGRFQMETAAGGKAAVQKLETGGPYAVVVTDLRMPELDGVALLSVAKRLAPLTVRILLTGNAFDAAVTGALQEGTIDKVLEKPCSPQLLREALNVAITEYRQKGQREEA